jgi:hypothetical protein
MSLKLTIEGARLIDKGVWKARLKPEETSAFGTCSSRSGPYSVLLLDAKVGFNERAQSITFDPNATRLLNVGSTDQIIILRGGPSQASVSGSIEQPLPGKPQAIKPPVNEPQHNAAVKKKIPEHELGNALSTGDKLFLSELPPDLREIGEALLSSIRSEFKGELRYEPRSAKFDETPEIFWTIKIQPQEKSLRLTVRGVPDTFPSIDDIDLKLDKFGYSAFVVTHKGQVAGAVSAIRQGAKNMED